MRQCENLRASLKKTKHLEFNHLEKLACVSCCSEIHNFKITVHFNFSLYVALFSFLNLVGKTFCNSTKKNVVFFYTRPDAGSSKRAHGSTCEAHSAGRGVWVGVYKHTVTLFFEIILVKVITQEIPMDD